MWKKVDSVRKLSAPFEFDSARRKVELMKTAPVSQPWLDRLESNALMVKIAANDTIQQAYAALSVPLKELYAALPDSVKQTPTTQRAYHTLFPPKKVKVGDEMADGVQGIPHYVLISPDRKVKDAWAGYGKGVIKDNLKTHIK